MRTLSLACLLAAFMTAPALATVMPNTTTAHALPARGAAHAANATRTALPPATETFTVGTLRVQRYGDHGRPVILIPGLASGPWVWDRTIRHLGHDHVVYALTLAGFDGLPPPAGKTGLMDQADASLLKLIQSRRIDHPVLIGHSLGGTLAIRFATEHSDLLGGVIAAEGLPVFPGAQDLTAAQRQARAKAMQARMAQVTPAQFKAQQVGVMKMSMRDPAMAAHYATLTARSDPAATAEYMAEDYAADHRPGLKNVSVPLLEISPYDAADYKQAAARSKQPLITEKAKADYYRQLLSGDPQAKVVSIAPSRHFVMLDQPQKFQAVIDHFIAALPRTK